MAGQGVDQRVVERIAVRWIVDPESSHAVAAPLEVYLAGHIVPSLRSVAIWSSPRPSSSLRMLSVCSPNDGGAPLGLAGVADRLKRNARQPQRAARPAGDIQHHLHRLDLRMRQRLADVVDRRTRHVGGVEQADPGLVLRVANIVASAAMTGSRFSMRSVVVA